MAHLMVGGSMFPGSKPCSAVCAATVSAIPAVASPAMDTMSPVPTLSSSIRVVPERFMIRVSLPSSDRVPAQGEAPVSCWWVRGCKDGQGLEVDWADRLVIVCGCGWHTLFQNVPMLRTGSKWIHARVSGSEDAAGSGWLGCMGSSSPSRLITRSLSPSFAAPCATRPVAILPTNESDSSIVTSILKSASGLPPGWGTCETMASRRGARVAPSGLPPSG